MLEVLTQTGEGVMKGSESSPCGDSRQAPGELPLQEGS